MYSIEMLYLKKNVDMKLRSTSDSAIFKQICTKNPQRIGCRMIRYKIYCIRTSGPK